MPGIETIFDGPFFAVSAIKDVAEYQAKNITCPHCSKVYSTPRDLSGSIMIDRGTSSMSTSIYHGKHHSFRIKFICSCGAIVTVVAPLDAEEWEKPS